MSGFRIAKCMINMTWNRNAQTTNNLSSLSKLFQIVNIYLLEVGIHTSRSFPTVRRCHVRVPSQRNTGHWQLENSLPRKPLYSPCAAGGADRTKWWLSQDLFGGGWERLRPVRYKPCARHHRTTVSYTHLRAHETRHDIVCRLLL